MDNRINRGINLRGSLFEDIDGNIGPVHRREAIIMKRWGSIWGISTIEYVPSTDTLDNKQAYPKEVDFEMGNIQKMIRFKSVVGIIGLLALIAGCGFYNVREHNALSPNVVRKLAAFDLSCDADSISLVELDHHKTRPLTGAVKTMGAEGCGRKTVYIVSGGTSDNPRWVRNSEVQNVPTESQTQPTH